MKPLAQNTLVQGRYLVVQLIGKGGMGEVYLAIDQRLGNPVALKRTMFVDDDVMGGAFEREARTLARLRHPALPKVSDHFTENENQYLVMEHIAGDDLGKRLTATGKAFPLAWVLFWADQLLEALAYLHSNEPPIIHRDIKPQNLKLTDENNIVLLDFGLSKSGLGQNADPTSGSSGSVLGYTPHFAPMEQIRGTGTNPKSDIYSLSATLYQFLSNICPPDALTRADAMLSGAADPLVPLHSVNPEVPKPVSDVIAKGMAVSQDQRHATAREMQKYLRDAYSRIQEDMGAKTVVMDTSSAQSAGPAEPDFGAATVIDASPSVGARSDSIETQRRQADIKTEVFKAPPVGQTVVEATPEPTAPAVSFGSVDTVSAPPASSGPAANEAASSGAESAAAEAIVVPAEKKRSKGLLIGVLVGFVVLAIVGAGAIGAAYYFLRSASTTPEEPVRNAAPSPSPTTKPSPSPSPSPSPVDSKAADEETKAPPSAPQTPPAGPRPQAQPKPQTQPKPTAKPKRDIPM